MATKIIEPHLYRVCFYSGEMLGEWKVEKKYLCHQCTGDAQRAWKAAGHPYEPFWSINAYVPASNELTPESCDQCGNAIC